MGAPVTEDRPFLGRISWGGPRRRIAGFLLGLIAVYVVVTVALSYLRFEGFATQTWDLGIYEQALWSATHGAHFYESADWETGGYSSFLQVHSAFVLYVIAPLYAAAPSALTLFVIQSVVVGAAALPLYAFARDRTGAPRLALAAPILYLTSAAVLAANLYDFHVEAFIPLEFFGFLFLWNRRQFLAGTLVALVAFLTLEVVPALIFFAALYFVVEAFPFAPRRAPGDLPRPSLVARVRRQLAAALRSREVVAALGLMVLSLVVFELLVLVRHDVLSRVFGIGAYPSNPTGYVVGGTPAALGLSLGHLAVGFPGKFLFWALALFLVGLLPVLAPRALLFAVPWFAFTLLTQNAAFSTWGFQYGFLAACALFPAVVLALPRAARIVEELVDAHLRRSERDNPPRSAEAALERRRRRTYRVAVVALAAVVAVNLLIGPVDPWTQYTPSFGAGYWISYTPGPGLSEAEHLAALVPAGATVLATPDLFPLVANNVHAYTLGSGTAYQPYFPFTPQHLPPYVILSQTDAFNLPGWLWGFLYNSTVYGVRGVVWDTPSGPILLFAAGYSGATLELGARPVFPESFSGAALGPLPLGTLVASGTASPAKYLTSLAGTNGAISEGPSIALPAGTYTITVSVRANVLVGLPAPSPGSAVLGIATGAYYLGAPVSVAVGFAVLNTTEFTGIAFTQYIATPTIGFALVLSTFTGAVGVTVASIEIAPAGAGAATTPPA